MNISLSSEKTRKLIIDVLLIEAGLAISSLGTAFFYSAELGSGAMATFSDGLHILLNVGYGTANTIANIFFLFILFALKKEYINVGTVLCVFTIGPWVNMFTSLIPPIAVEGMMVLRVVFVCVGAVLMGVGLGIYMAIGRGYGALEGIVNYVSEKTGLPIKTIKMIEDAVLSISGILLGGKWGIGTIVGIFLIGPVLQKSSELFTSFLRKTGY